MPKPAARPQPKNPILRTRAADAAAGDAQPCRARLDRGSGARTVRLAGLSRLRRRAISATRSLPRVSVTPADLAAAGREGQASHRNDLAHRAGTLLPRTTALAHRPCSPGRRRQSRCLSACRRRRSAVPRARRDGARSRRAGGAHRDARKGETGFVRGSKVAGTHVRPARSQDPGDRWKDVDRAGDCARAGKGGRRQDLDRRS